MDQISFGFDRRTEDEAMQIVKRDKIDRLKAMRDRYDTKAKTIRQKYWETGSGALKPAEDAEDIVDVIDMALRQIEDDGHDYLNKMENVHSMIARLGKETYTRDEVAALLKQTVTL